MHPDTDAPFEELVIAVRSFPNLLLELYQPDVTDDASCFINCHTALCACVSCQKKVMSEEDGTADCWHMILAPVGLQSFLLLHRRTRSSRARATPASDSIRGQRRHSPTHPNLATSRQPPQHCAGTTLASDTCRGQRWHFPTHSPIGNDTTAEIQYCAGATLASDTYV